jgi:hypothetical protein
VSVETPDDHSNRPGLDALAYRAGTYTSFFESMKARLSSVPALKTRDLADPAIAWLDAWSVVADILTFYQERIANEGYLRTAIERRSILELAALVGYEAAPGVASSTYLAYTLDAGSRTLILAGSQAQSIPGPGELPQTFETSADLDAAGDFSNLAPRMSRPQVFSDDVSSIYVGGVGNNLNPNDPVLVIASPPRAARIATVEIQPTFNRTLVRLQNATSTPSPATTQDSADHAGASTVTVESLIGPLSKAPAIHPATAADLVRRRSEVFDATTDTAPKLLQALHPETQGLLYAALGSATVTPPPLSELHAFRVHAAVFGHNAPLKPITDEKGLVIGSEEWPLGPGLSVLIYIPPVTAASPIRGATLDAARMAGFGSAESGTFQVFARAARGGQSGSTTFSITSREPKQQVPVGPWKLDVAFDAAKRELDLKFAQLERTYTISFDQTTLSLLLTIDGIHISVPVLQRATLDMNGRHIVGSIDAQGISLNDDSALPVDQPADIYLDSVYDGIVKGSWVLVARADTGKTLVTTVVDNAEVSLASYGISARATRLTLRDSWLDKGDVSLAVARNTTVFARSDRLPLVDEPLDDDVSGNVIELGDLYTGIEPGRWVIVEGERTDIPQTSGIRGAELMMVAAVEQQVQKMVPTDGTSSAPPPDRPGESIHSFLRFSNPLAYSYKRDSVVVYGNVLPATNGDSRSEVLGSGDSTTPLQQFTIHTSSQSPLTYVAAMTAGGIASTLRVFVNDVEWHQFDSLAFAGPADRCFTIATDDDDKVTVTFGDGVHGMRLPTGAANVRATYRVGIGAQGNVQAERITMLTTKPLGARAVINPLQASGGGDREGRDDARRNAPTAAIALNRLVSVQDHADFARTFAGVGKATAVQMSDGRRDVVFVTIAGAAGAVIDPTSALLEALRASFARFGDPHLPVSIGICRFLFLVIDAKVKVLPDYQWSSVAPLVKAALLDQFGFSRREIGEPAFLSSVVATIQSVEGVQYVVVDGFDSLTVDDLADATGLLAKFAEISSANAPTDVIVARSSRSDPTTGIILPAEIAFLNANATDTLLLTEITS